MCADLPFVPARVPDSFAERRKPAVHQQPAVQPPFAALLELPYRLRFDRPRRDDREMLDPELQIDTDDLSRMPFGLAGAPRGIVEVLGVQPVLGRRLVQIYRAAYGDALWTRLRAHVNPVNLNRAFAGQSAVRIVPPSASLND